MIEPWFAIPLGAILGLAILGALAFLVLTRLDTWQQARLQREGVQLQAEVTTVTDDEGGYWIHYRFRIDPNGTCWTGADWVAGERLHRPRVGDRISIFYLASHPEISLLAINCAEPMRNSGGG